MDLTTALAVMGLGSVFTREKVKERYRLLSKTRHPDAGGSLQAFLELNEAYKTLLNPPRTHVSIDPVAVSKMYPQTRWNETKFCQALCKATPSSWKFNVHGHAMQRRGVPDLYICHPKFRGWIELKVDKNTPSSEQISNFRQLVKLGDVCFFVRYCNDGRRVESFTPEVLGLVDQWVDVKGAVLDWLAESWKTLEKSL